MSEVERFLLESLWRRKHQFCSKNLSTKSKSDSLPGDIKFATLFLLLLTTELFLFSFWVRCIKLIRGWLPSFTPLPVSILHLPRSLHFQIHLNSKPLNQHKNIMKRECCWVKVIKNFSLPFLRTALASLVCLQKQIEIAFYMLVCWLTKNALDDAFMFHSALRLCRWYDARVINNSNRVRYFDREEKSIFLLADDDRKAICN